MLTKLFTPAVASLAAMVLITSCKKEYASISDPQPVMMEKGRPAPKGTLFYALTATGEIVKYTSGNPLVELSYVSVVGLAAMEHLLAIDFRPSTGQLYAVTNQSRIYSSDL